LTLPNIKPNLHAKFFSLHSNHHTKRLELWNCDYKQTIQREKTCYSIPCFLFLPFPLSFLIVRSGFVLVGGTSLPVAPSSALPRPPAATSSPRSRGTCSSWARQRRIRWRSTGFRKSRPFMGGSLCLWLAGWSRPGSRLGSGLVCVTSTPSWTAPSQCFRFRNSLFIVLVNSRSEVVVSFFFLIGVMNFIQFYWKWCVVIVMK